MNQVEFTNGTLFINHKLIKRNFLVKNNRLYLNYKKGADCKQQNIKWLVVSHSFIDMHAHTRVASEKHQAELNRFTNAALAGGFTTVVAMANLPVVLNERSSFLNLSKLLARSTIKIIQTALVSDQNKLTNFGALKPLTRVFSNDGKAISSPDLFEQALQSAATNKVVLALHEQSSLNGGVTYDAQFACKHDLQTVPYDYESKMVARDLKLNCEYNARLHFQHLSSCESIALIAAYKAKQAPISAEVTPHHLYFFSDDIVANHGNWKMNPPLNTRKHQKALCKALLDQTIDVIATDHAPHPHDQKNRGFNDAPFGVIGLETAFGAANKVLGVQNLTTTLAALTTNPGRILNLDATIRNGMELNLVFIDPHEEYICTADHLKGVTNSPFIDKPLKGKIKRVLYGAGDWQF